MKDRGTFAWVLPFLLGAAVMAPFSIPFIRPALAEVFTPQQLSDRALKVDDRLAAVEKQLAKIGTNNDPLGGSITQLQEQVNALQGQVKGLQSARDQARTDFGSLNKAIADQKTVLGSLQVQVGVNQVALDLITKKVGGSGSSIGDDVSTLKSGLASLRDAYNKHQHFLKLGSISMPQVTACDFEVPFSKHGDTCYGGSVLIRFATATGGTSDVPMDAFLAK